MGKSRVHGVALAAVTATLVVAGLSGCVGGTPTPVPTASDTPSPAASATPTAKPDPIIRPGDSAAANQQYFDFVNTAFYAAHGMSDGKSIIDNLIAAGFRKQDMEVTPDRTAIDLPVDSIIFSIRVKGECLVGQFAASGYHGEIGPLLQSGGCLVGTTRPIDW